MGNSLDDRVADGRGGGIRAVLRGDPLVQVTVAGKAVIGVDRGEVGWTFVSGVGWLKMPRYISGQSGDRGGWPWYPEEEALLLRLWDSGAFDIARIATALRRSRGGVSSKLGQLLIQRTLP